MASSSFSSATSSPQFSLAASWSKAGVGTCFVMNLDRSSPNKCGKIAFDMGATPVFDRAIPAPVVFVTHGHVDHVGAIFSHARAHAVSYSTNPTYYVPAPLAPRLERARVAVASLDACVDDGDDDAGARQGLLNMNIVPMRPGDEVRFSVKKSGTLFARAFAVDHGGHPALGYAVGRIVPGRGLRPEYRGLPKGEIGRLVRETGVDVKLPSAEVLEVCYTGDTCAEGIALLPPSSKTANDDDDDDSRRASLLRRAFRAPLVLCECTYLENNEKNDKDARGHMRLVDVETVLRSHGWGDDHDHDHDDQTIVLFHVSARWSPAARALDAIAAGLPRDLRERTEVSVASLLSSSSSSDEEKVGTPTKGSIAKRLIKENGCVSVAEYVRELERNGLS